MYVSMFVYMYARAHTHTHTHTHTQVDHIFILQVIETTTYQFVSEGYVIVQ